jgi:hypothetical protein
MNPLASRKLLLIAESELNRAQLVQEWQMMAEEVLSVADRVRTISCLVLAAASVVTGLASFRGVKSAGAGGKRPWWQTLLRSTQLAASLWSAFGPRPKS